MQEHTGGRPKLGRCQWEVEMVGHLVSRLFPVADEEDILTAEIAAVPISIVLLYGLLVVLL